MAKKTVFVQFGGTGDLAKNKLFPAYNKVWEKDHDISVVALGRRYKDREEFISGMSLSPLSSDFLDNIHYVNTDVSNPDIDKIASAIIDASGKEDFEIVYNLAVLPRLYESIVSIIRSISDTISKDSKRKVREKVVVEKPFGTDLESAKLLNGLLTENFREEDIFRMDHYLGKEFIQNILVMRFTNEIIQGVWNKDFIDHIQVIIDESSGIEDRMAFYEKVGIVRDMVQNHIFQIIAHLTMSEPSTFSSDAISHEKSKVLSSLRGIESPVLGSYSSLDRNIPTFVAFKTYVDTFDFSGVPIYVRTGKRLGKKASKIYVEFKNMRNKHERKKYLDPNHITIDIQPEMDIRMGINMKAHGKGWESRRSEFVLDHSSTYGIDTPEAYENVMEAIVIDDKSIFPSWEEIRESWVAVSPILDQKEKEIVKYDDGKIPKEAASLLEKDGRKWVI